MQKNNLSSREWMHAIGGMTPRQVAALWNFFVLETDDGQHVMESPSRYLNISEYDEGLVRMSPIMEPKWHKENPSQEVFVKWFTQDGLGEPWQVHHAATWQKAFEEATSMDLLADFLSEKRGSVAEILKEAEDAVADFEDCC